MTTSLTITLPMTPYRIVVEQGRREYAINLTPNSDDSKAAYWRTPGFRALLVAKARQEMRDAGYACALDALGKLGRTRMPQKAPVSVRMAVTIRTRTKARKDRDGAVSGLKQALDGVAQALGVNDQVFAVESVEFEVGLPEQTQIRVEMA